jgi:hypothetical protein
MIAFSTKFIINVYVMSYLFLAVAYDVCVDYHASEAQLSSTLTDGALIELDQMTTACVTSRYFLLDTWSFFTKPVDPQDIFRVL